MQGGEDAEEAGEVEEGEGVAEEGHGAWVGAGDGPGRRGQCFQFGSSAGVKYSAGTVQSSGRWRPGPPWDLRVDRGSPNQTAMWSSGTVWGARPGMGSPGRATTTARR